MKMVLGLALTLACATAVLFTHGAKAADVIWQDPERPGRIRSLRLELPLDDGAVCSAMLAWSFATGIPCGAECRLPDPRSGARGGERVHRYLDLSGLSARESLGLLVEHAEHYVGWIDDEFAVVRLSESGGGLRPSALDRRVPEFKLQNVSLQVAADAIFALVSPSAAQRDVRRRPGGARSIPGGNGRLLSVDLRDATLQQILTKVAQTHGGGVCWRLAYLNARLAEDESVVQFLGGGVSVSAGGNRIR